MAIRRKKSNNPPITMIFGPEGVGKSAFAATFPTPVFIDLEDRLDGFEVDVTEVPETWEQFQNVFEEAASSTAHQTIVIDTITALSRLASDYAVRCHAPVKSIEQIGGGYGKGVTWVIENCWSPLWYGIRQLKAQGKFVVLIAHQKQRQIEVPFLHDTHTLNLWPREAEFVRSMSDGLFYLTYDHQKIIDSKVGEKQMINTGTRVLYTQKRIENDGKCGESYGTLPEKILVPKGQGFNLIFPNKGGN